jgi:hypothetical protein
VTFTLTIAGVPKLLKAGSLNISMTSNGRATATFDVISEDRSYRPALSAAVIMEEDGTRIFGGFVNAVFEKGLGGGTGQPIVTTITAVDFNAYAELRYVDETIPVGSLEAALNVILPYLTDYGVTLDAGQVTGPTLPELNYELRRLDDVLNEFSTLTADFGQPFVWEIDEFKVLRMFQPSTTPAPFDLVMSGDEIPEVIGDIEVEITREHYANRIIVKMPPKKEESRLESFTGDGATDTFTLQYTPTKFYGYVTDDTAAVPQVNLGLRFVGDTDGQWEYDYVTNTITRLIGDLPNGQVATIKFDGTFSGLGIAEDAAEIAIHGIWEKVITVENIPTDATAQSLAEGFLAQFLPVTRKISYGTLELGVKPGQEQTATVPARNLAVTAPITDVVIRDFGARNLHRGVTSIADAETNRSRGFRSDYQEWWGDKAGGSTPQPVGAGGAVQVGPGAPDLSVQFNDNGAFRGDESFIYYKGQNSLVCGLDSSITAVTFESCQVFGNDCHIADP